jgi:hypothetical protein
MSLRAGYSCSVKTFNELLYAVRAGERYSLSF